MLLVRSISVYDYLEICKPKVVLMMLVTVLVGMVMATNTWLPLTLIFSTLVGIGACAASAAAMNHWLDRQLDRKMARTQKRPVAEGRLRGAQVIPFATSLAVLGLWILVTYVNALTAALTFVTLISYAFVYTLFLKRATPQNIVIGGLAGAAPPLLGWVAVTNTFSESALLLVLIIFTWTPPHFWALSLYRQQEYQTADIPMLPVIYGAVFTKNMIFLYSILLLIVSEWPYLVGMSGPLYGIAAGGLSSQFMYKAWKLRSSDNRTDAFRLFHLSIYYLLCLFVVLLIDHLFRMCL